MSHNLMNTDLESESFPIKIYFFFFFLNIFVKENKKEHLYINIIPKHLIKIFIIADVTLPQIKASVSYLMHVQKTCAT